MGTDIKFAPPLPDTLDPIIKRLRSATYREVRHFFAKNVKPRYPHFLYKYRGPVDGKAAHLRDMLIDGRLWLSSPRDFNDPFDMTARVNLDGVNPVTLRHRISELVEDRGKKDGLNWKTRQQKVNEIMARDRQEWVPRVKQIFEQNMSKAGVFSFAGNPRHILMWSHYAHHHTGICLQFEIARDPTALSHAVPVRYVRDYPAYNWVTDEGSQMNAALLNKFEAWDYQREFRILWVGGAHTYLPFAPAAVTGVILGARASEETKTNLKRLLDEREARRLPAIKTYAAQKHERRYALTVHRVQL